jgi:hypothetical protein
MGAETTISAMRVANPSDSPDVVTTIQQMVPAQPRWDVAVSSNRKLQIVYEMIGGAINSLILRTTSGDTKPLTGAHPLQSFSLPRFAKTSGGEPRWVTAVVDNHTCVALSLSGGFDLHPLDECADGLLVSASTGFVFLHKTTVPGVVRGNDIRPGRLYGTPLDHQFHPIAPPTEVVPSIVFEFDADIAGNKLIIAATTPGGISVASSDLPKLRFSAEEYSAPTALVSPGIVEDSQQQLTIGALAAEAGDRARVLIAQIAVP